MVLTSYLSDKLNHSLLLGGVVQCRDGVTKSPTSRGTILSVVTPAHFDFAGGLKTSLEEPKISQSPATRVP